MAKGTKTGGGSRKGVPNKISGDLREMILGALADAGGREYLKQQAIDSPNAFLALIGRTLPKDLNVSGEVRHTLAQMIHAGILAQQADDKREPLQ